MWTLRICSAQCVSRFDFICPICRQIFRMILDLKVRLSKFDLEELRIVAEKLEEVELDEDNELEVVLAQEMAEYIEKRIKKLEKQENE